MENIDFSEVENPDIREAYENNFSKYLKAQTLEEKRHYLRILHQISKWELKQIVEQKEALKRASYLKCGWDDGGKVSFQTASQFDFSEIENPFIRAAYEHLCPKVLNARTHEEINKYWNMLRRLGQLESKFDGGDIQASMECWKR